MWPFKKKYSIKTTGILEGFIDYHSHILPGVDDGIGKMEEALEVLKTYSQLGISQVWLTPHIMEDIPNTVEKLQNRFGELQQAMQDCKQSEPEVKFPALSLAAENMIDSLFVKRLESNELLPYGVKGDELLLETSYVQAPYGFYPILNDVKEAGYTPVLAHPERYQYMSNDDYDTLKSKGIKFQLNLLSLVGAYGPDAQRRAEYLISKHYYNYRGTDIHSLRNFLHFIELKAIKGDISRLML